MTIKAVKRWRSNAYLIADIARLGYLDSEWVTLDPTYGRGGWWSVFRPLKLIEHDIRNDGVDFRALPEGDRSVEAVAFDPPYKLVGTASLPEFDDRFGLAEYVPWQKRHELIRDGIAEGARVLTPADRVKGEYRGGILLVKCQDQVCSGAVRWQTREFADHAEKCGLRLVDRFDMLGGRPQPANRTRKPRKGEVGRQPVRQVHAQLRGSTLLVCRKYRRVSK